MLKFLRDCFFATVFVFIVLLSIREVSQFDVFNVFDPLGQALGDMELTDITFSSLRLEIPPVDENITIINIGDLSRAQLAQQIQAISQFKPKVIGIDSFFDCPGGMTDSVNCPLAYDTLSNLLLGNAIQEAGNVVLVTKLLQSKQLIGKYGGDIDKYDSLEHSDAIILGNAHEGYASLETNAEHQEDLKTCRSFNPKMTLENGETEYAFSVKIAMLFDSTKAQKFLSRENHSEVINYRGNVPDVYQASAKEFSNRYTYLDWYQPFDTASFLSSVITDRIVLFGYMGKDMTDTSWDDKFITPLNKQFAGKTRPDMYGVVVHANIISMILNENDYINQLAFWQEVVIAFIICFFNVMIFTVIMRRMPLWFDGLSLLLQLVQIVICTFLMMFIFKWFNFKLNLTLTLAALALVGTCFELYNGVLKAGISSLKKSRLFTKRNKEVLTSQSSDIS
jgi:CHASE2 domain-containing sensor protein